MSMPIRVTCPRCRQRVSVDVPAGEEPGRPGAEHICVPRSVIFAQGLLLGAVALVFFVLGLIVGTRSQDAQHPTRSSSYAVTGTVRWTDETRQVVPDAASRVIILPVVVRPDQKAGVEGFRPRDAEPDDTHPAVAMIRSIGGDTGPVDHLGRYRVRVPAPGRYFLLILSRHARRPVGEPPQARDLAELGRYFVPATNLLEDQQYLWREIQLRGDLRLDHKF
jgi:hypothetical protein